MFLTGVSVANTSANVYNNFNKIFQFFTVGMNGYLLGILYTIIPIIAYWYLFEKNNEKGWKIIIPIYNSYIQYKLFFNTGKFWRQLILGILFFIGICILAIGVGMSQGTANVTDQAAFTIIAGFLVMFVSFIWVLVIAIQYDIAICKKYGFGFWFTLGMIFITPIFIGILAYEVYKGRATKVDE